MSQEGRIAIIAPCYNEEELVVDFLEELSRQLPIGQAIDILLVDDGSTDRTAAKALSWKDTSGASFRVLQLHRNSGHQLAIAAGVKYALSQGYDACVVMDSDGEDDPAVIPELLERKTEIVQVTRGKRSEGIVFKLGYSLYKILFKAVTGKRIDFGNFSLIRRKAMQAVATDAFIHYPAFLSRLKFEKSYVQADRKSRLGGKSKMGFSGLAVHGLRALAEYSEELLLAFLKLTVLFGLVVLGFAMMVLYKKFFTDQAIPGWASTMIVGSFNAMLITGGFFILGVILLRMSRLQRHELPEIREV